MKFEKGKSGNPNGRPKAATLEEIRTIARKAAPEMVELLIAIAKESQSDRAKVAAANAVLDRGYGKPAQTIGDEEGNAMSWFDLLAASQRRAGLVEAPAPRLYKSVNPAHDVN